MYKKSSKFYDALYHFRDYHSASENLKEIILKYNPDAKTLLDTACGTGKHMSYIKENFETEGLDVNQELIDIARERCPGNIFHVESMIDFDLKKKYDVITCLFGSIAYVKTVNALNKTVETFSRHLSKGGLLIFEPYFSKEQFWTDRVTVNHYDEKDLKIVWMYVSKLINDHAVLDMNYLVGTPEEVSFFTEKHELGLFNDNDFREAMNANGLEVYHSDEGLFGKGVGNGIYIGVKK